MAPPRIVDPVGLYHVMSRGNYRQTIFPGQDHVDRYARLLSRVALKRRWLVVDWCLMPNHAHLLIQLSDDGLSDGMRELNGCYSRWSNALSERTGTGHLVQNRFKSKAVRTDSYLMALLRYLPCNPVTSGLVEHPDAWPWSGYRATVGLEHPPPFHRPAEILRRFHPAPDQACRLYRAHVLSGQAEEGPDPWSDDVVESFA